MYVGWEEGADAMQVAFLKLISDERLVPKRVADDIKIYMGVADGDTGK